jgi:alpha-L-rhamnosidase
VKYLRRLFERKTAILGAILLVFPCARSLAAQVAPNPASETVPPSSSLWPRDLRCEFIVDPLGVQSQQPALSWTLDAREKNARGLRQTAYRVLVSSSRKLLSDDQADVWDSAKTSSSQFVQVRYGGKALHSHTAYFWKVRVWDENGKPSVWSDSSTWTMGLLQPADWQARWIAAQPDPQSRVSHSSKAGGIPVSPLPLFRHEFRLNAAALRAIVYISGLGQYELRINGHTPSTDVLNPGWTNYHKTVLYNTYDVTNLLQPGENAIGVMLGNGMYNMPRTPGRYQKFDGTFGQPKLILQMHITFADGSETTVVSDHNWKVAPGPITFSSTYGGEDYDARKEPAGWDEPGAAEAAWAAAVEVAGPGGGLKPQLIPPIRVMQVYKPVKVSEPKPGTLVEDLGQNFSGWPQVTVRGPAGSTIKMIPGELLDRDGLVTQQSSGGPAYFSYTLKGEDTEVWHPRFTYYGFRYVQVEASPAAGSRAQPEILAVEGQFVHSSAAELGDFSTSDEIFNRIHKLIDAALLSNFQSVLTDCPHREKLGWLEQTHLMGSAIMLNYDVRNLYTKMANDMRDSQLPSGLVPEIAPEYVVFNGTNLDFRDSPEWGSAAIISPWIAFQHSGDLSLLGNHYDVMQRYVDYLSGRAQHHLLSYGLGDWYDRGSGPPGYSQLTSKSVTATAIYYDDLEILAKVALLLDKDGDAHKYGELARAVRTAFNAALFHPDTNQYDRGSQTADAMPLVLGLVPEDHRAAVLDNLVADIRRHQNHTTAGDIGYHFVLEALRESGRSDVIYDMLSRTDSPSYGYQLAMGATALTEAWDANPHSSQNHFMLGHAEDWFYRGLGGINVDLSRPSPEQVVIRPEMVGEIASAKASYDSVLGKIGVGWRREPKLVSLDVRIPPGSSATVYLPAAEAASITESGSPAGQAEDVEFIRVENKASVFRISSGHYHFEWPQPTGKN